MEFYLTVCESRSNSKQTESSWQIAAYGQRVTTVVSRANGLCNGQAVLLPRMDLATWVGIALWHPDWRSLSSQAVTEDQLPQVHGCLSVYFSTVQLISGAWLSAIGKGFEF